jgi:hypothetical protein
VIAGHLGLTDPAAALGQRLRELSRLPVVHEPRGGDARAFGERKHVGALHAVRVDAESAELA